MWVALDAARRCRAELEIAGPLTGEDLCYRLGLALVAYRLPGRVRGLYCAGNVVAVRPDLRRYTREHVIFHEVGHARLHGPFGGMDFWRERDPVMLRKIERRADEFAYFCALPGDELRQLLWEQVPVWEIAGRYNRSPQWVWQRIHLAWDAGELDALKRQEWIA